MTTFCEDLHDYCVKQSEKHKKLAENLRNDKDLKKKHRRRFSEDHEEKADIYNDIARMIEQKRIPTAEERLLKAIFGEE